jgi:hypothetical protein
MVVELLVEIDVRLRAGIDALLLARTSKTAEWEGGKQRERTVRVKQGGQERQAPHLGRGVVAVVEKAAVVVGPRETREFDPMQDFVVVLARGRVTDLLWGGQGWRRV